MPAGHLKVKLISKLESKGDENNLDQTFMNVQAPSTLEEMGPLVPAAPAATPVCVKQEIPTSNAATLEVLESAISSDVNTKLIDQRMTFASCSDFQSTEFLPLMPIKDEPESDDVSDQLNIGSDDTNDSYSTEQGNRTSPKSWTSADMDNALEALKTQHMSLTKASATFGIPSTTLWQRAHRLGIDTPKKEGSSKSWSEEDLNAALQALRDGVISANKASKAYGIPSSTLYKIARREGIRLAAPFNAAPTSWRRNDLNKALEAIRAGQYSVQRAASHFGIPSGTLYGRCKREGIGLTRSNPTPWSEDAMGEALEAVRVGQMSINQAAIHFNLPYSSLYGRFKRLKCPPPPDLQQDTQINTQPSSDQQDTQTNDPVYTQEFHSHADTLFFPHLYQYHSLEAPDPSTGLNESYMSDSFSESAMYHSQGWYGIATTS